MTGWIRLSRREGVSEAGLIAVSKAALAWEGMGRDGKRGGS